MSNIGGALSLSVNLMTDNYPDETSWILQSENHILAKVEPKEYDIPNNLYTHNNICVPSNKCFDFIIEDTYGEGICCNGNSDGYYEVVRTDDGSVLMKGGDFAKEEVKSFCPSSFCSTLNNENYLVSLQIKTDRYPEETSWTFSSVVSSAGGKEKIEKGEYTEGNFIYIHHFCIPSSSKNDCFEFHIEDELGDGLCCEFGDGYYKGFVNGELVFEGSKEFGPGGKTETYCPSTLP
eukprot:CAMPEP_0178940120 /NCGR_PEP_ID=MMETSP0789-20121207/618_1 /TAXON_ID=3005 /ORGANISM="Rhizosolenia setigera, Strain CCMP 1694" /LENGTH=234 /DNA_ID=CAMNT_0020619095 /DNA_START=97 /DNA_END=798 /DNA_ORIENTATION=+